MESMNTEMASHKSIILTRMKWEPCTHTLKQQKVLQFQIGGGDGKDELLLVCVRKARQRSPNSLWKFALSRNWGLSRRTLTFVNLATS